MARHHLFMLLPNTYLVKVLFYKLLPKNSDISFLYSNCTCMIIVACSKRYLILVVAVVDLNGALAVHGPINLLIE